MAMELEPFHAADRAEAMALVRAVAEPGGTRGEAVKVKIARAATLLGWSYSRTEDIWYGLARKVDVELAKLRKWRPS